MKTILDSFLAAFSMYSVIPVPTKKIKADTVKYTLCFFPLVGALTGFFVMLWINIAYCLSCGSIVKGALICAIPVLITGGIHFDGFLDTTDALCSHKPRKEKLEILKDPHIGAFAVIWGVVYMILYFAMWTDLSLRTELILCIGFVLSRALSALSCVTFLSAKRSGLLYSFAESSDRRMVIASSLLYTVVCVVMFIIIDWQIAVFVCAGAAVAFAVYRVISYTQFNGITGDIAGFFLCLCELLMVIFAQFGELIWSL